MRDIGGLASRLGLPGGVEGGGWVHAVRDLRGGCPDSRFRRAVGAPPSKSRQRARSLVAMVAGAVHARYGGRIQRTQVRIMHGAEALYSTLQRLVIS